MPSTLERASGTMANNTQSQHTIKVRYFAWLREKTGVSEETIAVPASVSTVADLMAWMASRDDKFAAAFAAPGVIRTALDHAHVKPDAPLGTAREIAFFPPVTGG